MVDSLPLTKYYHIHPKYSWFRLASILPIASAYLLSFNGKPYSIKRNFSTLTPSLINYEFPVRAITRNKSLSTHHDLVDNEPECSSSPIISSKKVINNTERTEILLLDIGPLVKGTLLKRPSATIKSPYVADVKLLPSMSFHDDKQSNLVLAHAPALGVGGLCNPNKPVYLSTRDKKSNLKTSHSIELAVSLGCTPSDPDVLVGANPRLAETLVERVLKLGLLQDVIGYGPVHEIVKNKNSKKNSNIIQEISKIDEEVELKKQFTYGDSRIDFALQSSSKLVLIEVKNVVCSDYNVCYAPTSTSKRNSDNICIITSDTSTDKYERSGLFPWGRVNQKFEGKKVVSERAIKHVRNLASAITTKNAQVQSIIIFVINKGDCKKMRCCHGICPAFAEEVRIAREKGVIITSFSVHWTSYGKTYCNGIISADT